MSETVHYVGKLIYISKYVGEDLEAQCKRLMNNEERPKGYDSNAEWLIDDSNNRFYTKGENLYEIKYENCTYLDIFNAHLDDFGDINFDVKYYNGGCGFTEALDIALSKLNLSDDNG